LRQSRILWTDATLDRFIQKPAAAVPGTTMAYQGMAKPEDRRALIAFLKQASRP